MTTRERICTALMGQMPDRVPLTTYRGSVSAEEGFDKLVAQGLGFMVMCRVYNMRYRNVEIDQENEVIDGILTKVVRYKTPVGEIWERLRTDPGYGSNWRVEHLVKDMRDYEVLEFIIRDAEYSPDYETCRKAEESVGDSGVTMARMERSPIQNLWTSYTGIERLSFDLYDNPSVIESLMEAMMDKYREMWNIVADSPSRFIWCPDNITGEVTGPPMFDKYCLPYYREISSVMHRKGKRILCHMDGQMRRLVDSVRMTNLDVIEAFTPPPDGDLSLAEARKAWQNKVISINFPSSVHLARPQTIRDVTLQLLREAAPGNGFVIGVTEKIPKFVGTRSLSVIAETINEYGDCPISIG